MHPTLALLLILNSDRALGPANARPLRLPGDLRELAHDWAEQELQRHGTLSAVVVVEAEDETLHARFLAQKTLQRALTERRPMESPGNLALYGTMKAGQQQPWQVGR